MLSKKVGFEAAVPVWCADYAEEMNISIVFRAVLGKIGGANAEQSGAKSEVAENKNAVLRIAGSSAFQIYVNGEFYGMGPARAGHGYYRVDEYEIGALLVKDANVVDITVAGYNNNSFYWIDVPPFLAAEIVGGDGKVLARTANSADGADNAFKGYLKAERVQKVQRYSFQRNFVEVYDYNKVTDFGKALELSEVRDGEERNFIERGIFYPEYDREDATRVICRGRAGRSEKETYFKDRALHEISPALKGFKIEELDVCSIWEAEKLDFAPESYDVLGGQETVALPENGYAVYELARNSAGLIGLDVRCEGEVTVYALFDEILTDNDADKVDFLRLGTSSVVMWTLPVGNHELLTFEPYVFKYLKIVMMGAASEISNVHIRRVGFYMPERQVKGDNPKIKAVYDAAVETFRQNVCDIYMDCASRERGGWLGDSFFTARAEYVLTGKSEVERNFIENFLQPDSFKCLPEGMLPMCYPADHYDGLFIPNWTMWLVLEIDEYFERTGDKELIDAAKPKIYKLMDYFKKLENADGLLDKLESWVFVEWSRANELVQDINYPTNMLYAVMKRIVGKLYGDEKFIAEAEALTEEIRKQSFDGKFFCDNAVYNGNGVAELSGECTEACQYYAFYTKIATPELYPELWKTLLEDFGPRRRETGKYPEISFANVMFGQFLRMDMLIELGYNEELLNNIEGYFYYMAEKTGTLWENDTTVASCSHGFTSHVIYWLDKLGMIV